MKENKTLKSNFISTIAAVFTGGLILEAVKKTYNYFNPPSAINSNDPIVKKIFERLNRQDQQYEQIRKDIASIYNEMNVTWINWAEKMNRGLAGQYQFMMKELIDLKKTIQDALGIRGRADVNNTSQNPPDTESAPAVPSIVSSSSVSVAPEASPSELHSDELEIITESITNTYLPVQQLLDNVSSQNSESSSLNWITNTSISVLQVIGEEGILSITMEDSTEGANLSVFPDPLSLEVATLINNPNVVIPLSETSVPYDNQTVAVYQPTAASKGFFQTYVVDPLKASQKYAIVMPVIVVAAQAAANVVVPAISVAVPVIFSLGATPAVISLADKTIKLAGKLFFDDAPVIEDREFKVKMIQDTPMLTSLPSSNTTLLAIEAPSQDTSFYPNINKNLWQIGGTKFGLQQSTIDMGTQFTEKAVPLVAKTGTQVLTRSLLGFDTIAMASLFSQDITKTK